MSFLKKAAGYLFGISFFGLAVFGVAYANATTTEIEEREETVNYSVETIKDNTLRKGTTKVKQEGKNGSKTVTYSVVYNRQGKEVDRVKKSEVINKKAQNKIVLEGTLVLYKCSDGTEFYTVAKRDACEKKVAWRKERDRRLQECYADSDKFNCWYDEYPGTTLHWSYWVYTPSYNYYRAPQVNPYRSGAICRDGWRSSATGRGACSHHGGVSMWI